MQIKDIIEIYKADGTAVDVTKFIETFSVNKGDTFAGNDGYTDNPITSAEVTLFNTNDMQFNHKEKGKIVYEEYTFTGNGSKVYDNPIEYLIEARVLDNSNYNEVSYSEGKLMFALPVNGSIKLFIARHNPNINNPLNFINGAYAQFIRTGTQITWKRIIFDQVVDMRKGFGNGTNKVAIYLADANSVENIKLLTSYTRNNFSIYDARRIGIHDARRMSLYDLRGGEKENINNLKILSYEKFDNRIEITFDAIIENSTTVEIIIEKYINQKTLFLLDGVIAEYINTKDVSRTTFHVKDNAYFLQTKQVELDTFRKYHTLEEEGNFIVTEQVFTGIQATGTTLTGSNTTFNNFAVGQTIYLYNKFDEKNQKYIKRTITAISSNTSMTINEAVSNAIYSIYAPVNNTLETHIAKCLQDTADNTSNFNLVVEDPSNWQVIPKLTDMQNLSVWDYIQMVTMPSAMYLGFKFQPALDRWALTLKNIPTTLGTPKYTIRDKDILENANYEAHADRIRTSWRLTYFSAETKKQEKMLVDDFVQAGNCSISLNRNVINTTTPLNFRDRIRVDNQYRIIQGPAGANSYFVNTPFDKTGSFDLFLEGPYTKKWGLIGAEIELDSTSSIDTQEEAERFLNIIKPQYLDLYTTYELRVRMNKFNELDIFDTIEIDSAKLGLFKEKLHVTNIRYEYNRDWYIVFSCSKQATVGEFKYTRLITETGLNKIQKDDNLNTGAVPEAPYGLTVSNAIIDRSNGYKVYIDLFWDDFIDRQVTWELQYKKQDESWDNAVSSNPSQSSQRIVLEDSSYLNIRVRAMSKTGVVGNWSEVDSDNTKVLVENPIQNRTWYVRLFFNNDYNEYFTEFDKLGYTQAQLDEAIDTIEIVPNVSSSSPNTVVWSQWIFPTPTEGLQETILSRLSGATKKNLSLRAVQGGYYKVEGRYDPTAGIAYPAYLDLEKFENVTGNGEAVIRGFETIYTVWSFNETGGKIKLVENLIVQVQADSLPASSTFGSPITGIRSQAFVPLETTRTAYKDIFCELIGTPQGSHSASCFDGLTRVQNCFAKANQTVKGVGFVVCQGLENCVADGLNIGYQQNTLMLRNKANNNCVTKYRTNDTTVQFNNFSTIGNTNFTYRVPANGGDNPNAGFNT